MDDGVMILIILRSMLYAIVPNSTGNKGWTHGQSLWLSQLAFHRGNNQRYQTPDLLMLSWIVSRDGELTDSFMIERGIHQDCPLSLYLFVLCIERLSHLFTEKLAEDKWRPFPVGRWGLTVSHLMFADDLLLFVEASPRQAMLVEETLSKFSEASRLQVNKEKSTIFFSPNCTYGNEIKYSRNLPL